MIFVSSASLLQPRHTSGWCCQALLALLSGWQIRCSRGEHHPLPLCGPPSAFHHHLLHVPPQVRPTMHTNTLNPPDFTSFSFIKMSMRTSWFFLIFHDCLVLYGRQLPTCKHMFPTRSGEGWWNKVKIVLYHRSGSSWAAFADKLQRPQHANHNHSNQSKDKEVLGAALSTVPLCDHKQPPVKWARNAYFFLSDMRLPGCRQVAPRPVGLNLELYLMFYTFQLLCSNGVVMAGITSPQRFFNYWCLLCNQAIK